eukprot:g5718.t1
MLPGYVAGYYTYDDVHIDLCRLTRFAQSRLIHAEATGLDVKSRRILFQNRPPLKYDVVSIDIGSTPKMNDIPGAKDHTTAVKPISTFIQRLHEMLNKTGGNCHSSSLLNNNTNCSNQRIQGPSGVSLGLNYSNRSSKSLRRLGQRGFSLVVVGGGAGGVELALAIHHRLQNEVALSSQSTVSEPIIKLVTRKKILMDYPTNVQSMFIRVFNQKGIEVLENSGVREVKEGRLVLHNRRIVEFDACLCLISTGDKHCIAHKGWFSWQGAFLWTLKDAIDRQFMNKYSKDLTDLMDQSMSGQTGVNLDEAYATCVLEKQVAALQNESLFRCAGCGSKVGMSLLKNVLKEIYGSIQYSSSSTALSSSGDQMSSMSRQRETYVVYDDAAVVPRPPEGYLMLQTTDFLRSFVSDPFLFGQITALHCLSDIYAMGGTPNTLLATVVVPFAAEDKMESDLIQLMFGAKKVCEEAGCEIVGGHSSEGSDLYLGFSVLGLVKEGQQLNKTGLNPEESLILTKPLGTGLILAAEMRGKAKASWIKSAVDCMLISNESAGRIFIQNEASSCTDVTGFGLFGHMYEMIISSKTSVKIDTSLVPFLPGAEDCAKSEIRSSLFKQNSKVKSAIANSKDIENDWRFPVLVDPQTSGGLLASVPKRNTEACLKALHEAGYSAAAIIGETMDCKDHSSPLLHII